jgi:hypothetical protein
MASLEHYRAAIAVATEAAASTAPEFRVRAFEMVLDSELSTQPSTVPASIEKGSRADPTAAATSGGIAALAQFLEVPVEDATLIFDVEAEAVRLAFPPSYLDKTMAGATQQVFFLICAARQIALGSQDTDMDTIRAAVSDNGKYDAKNFASALNALTGLAILSGTPRSRRYRLTRAGLEKAKSVAAELLQKINRPRTP